MKRYIILSGDKTTAEGIVLAPSTTLGLNEQNIAHEYDEISCPACNSTGKIQCDGTRIPVTGPDGRRVALSDDLCICKCSPPPKLVASQQVLSIDG
ncbi:PAAR domain-containing protein [Paraburkholderia bannensis]|uniref:PAAR domain-containing protein n=1 Tax=Paraburkholderia bannensis TaxID=765414 RepID=UPI002ABDD209|nr:PAAR domain-containing protein [Paraburkholderia bannensis]